MHKRSAGFTIVELLIVIVVIAILATISIVSYRNIQDSARDTRRASDIEQIKKALLSYDALHGGVVHAPVYRAAGENAHGGWDMSTRSNWLSFLKSNNGAMPIDPQNTPPPTPEADATSSKARQYIYYCYNNPYESHVTLLYRKSNGTEVYDSFPVSSCLNSIPS